MRANTFVKHAVVYGAGTILLQAAGFILLPIYTRYLDPAEFGVLEVSLRLGEILTICLMLPGLRSASHAFFRQADDEAERRRVVASAITLVLVISAVSTGILMVTAGPLARAAGIQSAWIFRMAFLVLIFEAIATIPLVIAQASLESGFFVATTSLQFLTKICLGILFVAVFRWGLWGVQAAQVLTSATFAIGLTIRELSKGWAKPNRKIIAEMLGFGYPFVAVGIGSLLLHDGDRFFLLRYAGEAAVGIYAFGYKIARLVSMFSREPLHAVWAAHMYDVAKEPNASGVFGRAFTRIIGFYIVVGLALCLLQDEVTMLLGGAAFGPAAHIMAPVVLAYAFLAAAETMDSGFYVRRKTGVKFWITLGSTAVMLVLYALLIPKFGIEGAAFATLLGFVFNAWLTWKVSQRVFSVDYEFGRLGALLALAALFWAFSRLLPSSFWLAPAKVGLWVTWLAALWTLGIVNAGEKTWVVDTLKTFLAQISAYLFPPRVPEV